MAAPEQQRDTQEDDTILKVRDASVRFEMSRGSSRVLDNVSIDLEREEILGVVGESGSGKSMFASALLDSVDEPGILTGDITYYPDDGEPVDLLSLSTTELKEIRWEEIAFVVQGSQSGFNPTMTIRDHFLETLRGHDADIEEGMERTNELLENLYLEPGQVLDSYAHELSGGMKQRTLIALGLVLEPNVLVLDEPTSALDLLMQRSILTLLNNLQETYSLTLVFITHDLPLVTDLADRLAVMYAFEFVETGPTEAILAESGHPYTRALLNAVPNLSTPTDEMAPIEGSAPDPVNTPAGCSYHPRCPLADDLCVEEDPPLEQIDTGEETNHRSACHYSAEARDAIPLSHEEADQ
jgi:oligopeptide/dipeptide ABC transporter ATP-binding protein